MAPSDINNALLLIRVDDEIDEEMNVDRQAAYDAVLYMADNGGVEVEEASPEFMDGLAELAGVMLEAKRKSALKTASPSEETDYPTVVSSAEGANIIKDLQKLAEQYEGKSNRTKTFIGDVASKLKAKPKGSKSEYASFETKNGTIITIRLGNHNATVSNFDYNGEDEGISIVISTQENKSLTNDGKAHVVEFYYNDRALRRAEGKPLVQIIRSIEQALYSGVYKDTTGLAKPEEVNVRFLRDGRGVVYGAAMGGKIYLNRARLNPNTPLHEYTHIWDIACKKNNPELWRVGVALMKQTSLWQDVVNDPAYANLKTDDEIASEVHSRLTGKNGAKLLERLAREAREAQGVFAKAEATTIVARLKRWLSEFWMWAKDTMAPWTAEEASRVTLEDFINMPLIDLAKGTRLEVNDGSARFQFIGERGAGRLDAAEEATTRLDNLGVAREMEEAFNEKKARIEKLRKSKPVKVEWNDEFELDRSSAKQWLKENLRGEYVIADTNEKVHIGRKGVNKVTSHSMGNEAHMKSLISVPDMLKNAIFIAEEKASKASAQYPKYRYYVVGLKIDGVDYTAKLTIGVDENGNKYYDHALTELEKSKLLDLVESQAAVNGFISTGAEPNPSVTVSKDTKLLSLLQANDQENARKIKLATGWERGADGKWRYEVMDFERFDPNGNILFEKHHPDYARYKELNVKSKRASLFNEEKLTEDERAELDELRKKWGGMSGIKLDGHHTLEAYIEADELFAAYPALRQLRIEYGDLPDDALGQYSRGGDILDVDGAGAMRITLSNKLSKAPRSMGHSVLLHEIQHAIQDIEGFAQGGSVAQVKQALNEIIGENEAAADYALGRLRYWADIRSAITKLSAYKNLIKSDNPKLRAMAIDNYWYAMNLLDNEDSTQQLNNYERDFGEDFDADEIAESGYHVEEAEAALAQLRDEVRGSIPKGNMDSLDIVRRLKDALGTKSDYELYLMLAGEVEARNVTSRMDMTAEERRQSLAKETEDVAREDQIFLEGSLGVAQMGSTTDNRMKDIAGKLAGRELTEEQKAVAMVYSGQANNLSFTVNRSDGKRKVTMRQGNDDHAGTKHSVFRHYGTRNGTITVDDILRIPEIIAKGELTKADNGKNIYTYTDSQTGTKYTVLTQDVKGHENFADFYTNKKSRKSDSVGRATRGSDTSNDAHRRINSASERKDSNNSTNEQVLSENDAVSRTDEDVVNEEEANGGGTQNREKKKEAKAGSSREAMADAVRRLVELLHLNNVEVLTDKSGLKGRKARAKGFYDLRTGKITIVLPNNKSVSDVVKTLLHEAVVHHGLRRLFGEHFDAFLDHVYQNASEEVRRRIVALAKKHGWDVRTATEEYLASLAEETDFENVDASLWKKIKNFFMDMLRKAGFGDVTLTDNELRYILWRSYENLKGGTGVLAEAADVAKRYELKVGEFAESSAAEESEEAMFRDGDPERHDEVRARDVYEQRVRSSMYQTKEAVFDSMRGLYEGMEAVLGKGMRIEEVADFENAYIGENALSSINKEEMEAFARLVFKPLLDEVSRLAKTEKERRALMDYMMAKHGL